MVTTATSSSITPTQVAINDGMIRNAAYPDSCLNPVNWNSSVDGSQVSIYSCDYAFLGQSMWNAVDWEDAFFQGTTFSFTNKYYKKSIGTASGSTNAAGTMVTFQSSGNLNWVVVGNVVSYFAI